MKFYQKRGFALVVLVLLHLANRSARGARAA